MSVQLINGRAQVRTGKVELGQGLHTALAQIVADELGLALADVQMLPVDTTYSPDQGVTSGSLSVQDAGQSLRQACALLRGGAPAPVVARPAVGQSLLRPELTGLFAGRPFFIHDLQPAGLLHGRVLHTSAAVLAWDEAAARAAPGLLHLLRDGELFGVVAADTNQVDAAFDALQKSITWQTAAALPDEDAAALCQLPASTRVVFDSSTEPSPQAPRLQRRYSKPWIAHASIAPSCALALWQGTQLQVWTHSQGIFNLRRDLALAFSIDVHNVSVCHVPGAGCYGHNGADDVAFDAAWLARTVPGHTLRVLWSRADELTHAPFGPAMVVDIDADFDDSGRITRWQQQVRSPGHSRRPGRSATPALLGA